MIRIAICDDDIYTTSRIEELLIKYCAQHSIKIDTSVFFDGIELEKHVFDDNTYDLIYLDIAMKHHDGLTTAKNIRKKDSNVIIIFISNYDCYLRQLFEVQPLAFLDKPVDTNDFNSKFRLAYNTIIQRNYYFEFKYDKSYYKILFKDIIYFESQGHSIIIHLNNGRIQKLNSKLSTIEKEIENYPVNFIRIHQSFYVNYDYIEIKKPTEVVLQNGLKLHISEDRQKNVREVYLQILRKDLFND